MYSPSTLLDNRLNYKSSRLSNPIQQKDIISNFAKYLISQSGIEAREVYDSERFFEVKKIKNNDFYFSNHKERKEIGFIRQGGIKLYREYEGKQQVINLFKDCFWGSMKYYIPNKSTNIYKAVCVEDTIMVTISDIQLRRLFQKHPAFVNYFNELNEDIFLLLEKRLTSLQIQSAQERYEDLLNNDPELLIRFSLQDIANYLGMRQETLSRIRNIANGKRGSMEQKDNKNLKKYYFLSTHDINRNLIPHSRSPNSYIRTL